MWEPQWEALAERFTLIRFDMRGFGESADPDGPFSSHGDAIEVLDAAGIDRCAVVGCSFGGRTALDLALEAPERVSALVVVCSTPSGWEHSDEMVALWEEVEAAYDRGGIAEAGEVEMRIWLDGVGRSEPVDPALRTEVGRVNDALLARQEAFEEIEPDEIDPPAVARLGEITSPVLVITGVHDQPDSVAGARAIAAGTGAELVEIPGAAHLPSLERPEEFNRVLTRFVES
jgi:pimeloyl-ACP methyl ester carboxylesterase